LAAHFMSPLIYDEVPHFDALAIFRLRQNTGTA
jgi:hypothetical protein